MRTARWRRAHQFGGKTVGYQVTTHYNCNYRPRTDSKDQHFPVPAQECQECYVSIIEGHTDHRPTVLDRQEGALLNNS